MTNWRSSAGTLLVVVTSVCAVLVTVAVVHREFYGSTPTFRPRSIRDYSPVPVDDWKLLASGGRRIGPDAATLTIVEFGDFQCPGCKMFYQAALTPLMVTHPKDVALVFYHWPLPYHPYAYSGARAAECAAAQGRFGEMVGALYNNQDSLGHVPMSYFARIAGVPNEDRFNRCAGLADSIAAISHGSEVARRLGAMGTPTLIVNGQLLRYVPDSLGLAAIFDQAQSGSL